MREMLATEKKEEKRRKKKKEEYTMAESTQVFLLQEGLAVTNDLIGQSRLALLL